MDTGTENMRVPTYLYVIFIYSFSVVINLNMRYTYTTSINRNRRGNKLGTCITEIRFINRIMFFFFFMTEIRKTKKYNFSKKVLKKKNYAQCRFENNIIELINFQLFAQ